MPGSATTLHPQCIYPSLLMLHPLLCLNFSQSYRVSRYLLYSVIWL